MSETDREKLKAELAEIQKRRQQIEQALAGIAPEQSPGVDQCKQTVNGPQTNIAGDVTGPVLSGSFQGPVNLNSFEVKSGSTVYIFYGQQAPAALEANDPQALRKYLDYLIAEHQHLKLQGIRSGSQALSVALEQVYISLNMTQAPGGQLHTQEGRKVRPVEDGEFESSGPLSLAAALQKRRRLVIIGDPGSGKTTLLGYLALTYARALRDGCDLVNDRLGLAEAGHLPVFLPLRNLGAHIRSLNPAHDGAKLLLDYLNEYSINQDVCLPADFFKAALENGQAVLLLDGLDEVAEAGLRSRIARLIEKFAQRYPQTRIVTTSRIAGYDGPARIGENFGLGRVRDLNREEVRRFVSDWQTVVEVTLSGSDTAEIRRKAARQAESLIAAIENNERVGELAVNPLLLTVIALVHRYRARLPERRADLYEEAVEVLLGGWDEGKGLEPGLVLPNERRLDTGDLRSLLGPVAFWMHENRLKESQRPDLENLLRPRFQAWVSNAPAGPDPAGKLLEAYLKQTAERNGLFVERGPGVFAFSHLTFQEYLAARQLGNRPDNLDYTRNVLADPWWREVILLQAGYLSNQAPRPVTELIRAIMDAPTQGEPEPLHALRLAAECLQDAGEARLEPGLPDELRARLQTFADLPLEKGNKPNILRKIHATNTLARMADGKTGSRFWKPPHGEPQWVEIPAGAFVMGSKKYDDEKPVHTLELPAYAIAITPVTNAQYALYIQDTRARAPTHWKDGKVLRGLENHPVVYVGWYDALAYCRWLSEKTNQKIALPSEAEWEKAARGTDGREFPWGNERRELHCNSSELGLSETTPVGLFLNGASPYGVLDLSGNIFEWTRSKKRTYPYQSNDGRENLSGINLCVLRGGSWDCVRAFARCATRSSRRPGLRNDSLGFRVVRLSGMNS